MRPILIPTCVCVCDGGRRRRRSRCAMKYMFYVARSLTHLKRSLRPRPLTLKLRRRRQRRQTTLNFRTTNVPRLRLEWLTIRCQTRTSLARPPTDRPANSCGRAGESLRGVLQLFCCTVRASRKCGFERTRVAQRDFGHVLSARLSVALCICEQFFGVLDERKAPADVCCVCVCNQSTAAAACYVF